MIKKKKPKYNVPDGKDAYTDFGGGYRYFKKIDNELKQKKMKQGYDTNLASEFFVLSNLHRLGLKAHLTLGLRKSVDILIEKPSGQILTVDVKGMARKTSWWADNIKKRDKNHFLIFVSYLGKIQDPKVQPEVFIIPSLKIEELSSVLPSGIKKIEFSHIRKNASQYKDAWELLIEEK